EKAEYLADPQLKPQINRATYGLYAPGSVFKIVVAMAALEAGLNPKERPHNPPDPADPAHGPISVARRQAKDLAPPGVCDFRGDTANLCIGQGEIAVTPLQVAVMIAAVANGGKVLWPKLVARIESQDPFSDDSPVTFPAAHVRDELKVSKRTLEVIRDAMLADV